MQRYFRYQTAAYTADNNQTDATPTAVIATTANTLLHTPWPLPVFPSPSFTMVPCTLLGVQKHRVDHRHDDHRHAHLRRCRCHVLWPERGASSYPRGQPVLRHSLTSVRVSWCLVLSHGVSRPIAFEMMC